MNVRVNAIEFENRGGKSVEGRENIRNKVKLPLYTICL